MATQVLDPVKAEQFAGKMLNVLNDACLTLLVSVGHQTGLFDKMSKLPPSTVETIAGKTELNERYVREWLGGMVTGRIIEYDPTNLTYFFPPEHASFLTREAGPNNFSIFAQYIPLFAGVENQIVDCFRVGGGVPYSSFKKFQSLQAEESSQIHDAKLINAILPLVPGLVEKLERGVEVADIGCGQGHAINLMAKAFPNSYFKGYDFSKEGITTGREEAKKLNLKNASFELIDVSNFNERNKYYLITAFDAIHDQIKPAKVLKSIETALVGDGVFLMVDVAASSLLQENLAHPLGTALYTVSTFHCMTVSLANHGDGLGTVWGEQKARQMLFEAGFNNIEVTRLPEDFLNNYYISRKN